MKMNILLLPLTFLFLSNANAYSSNCSDLIKNVKVSSSKKTFAINFKNYQMDLSNQNIGVVRESCNIAIPVSVPKNKQVAVASSSLKGKVDIAGDADAHVAAEAFIFSFSSAGQKGILLEQDLVAPVKMSLALADVGNSQWSGCGDDVNLRFNSSVLANKKSATGTGKLAISSAKIRLAWRSCK